MIVHHAAMIGNFSIFFSFFVFIRSLYVHHQNQFVSMDISNWVHLVSTYYKFLVTFFLNLFYVVILMYIFFLFNAIAQYHPFKGVRSLFIVLNSRKKVFFIHAWAFNQQIRIIFCVRAHTGGKFKVGIFVTC